MQPKDFKYQLKTPGGTFDLEYSPIGWQDYGTEWERHRTRYGYGRKYVTELQFVKDGYHILVDQYDQYGIEADVQLIVHRLNRNTYQYHVDFIGDVDFSQVEDNRFNGGFMVTQINESGFAKLLAARSKDVFELTLPETMLINHTANALQIMNWMCHIESHHSVTSQRYNFSFVEYNSDVSSNHLRQMSPSGGDERGSMIEVGVLLEYWKWLETNSPVTLKFSIEGTIKMENYFSNHETLPVEIYLYHTQNFNDYDGVSPENRILAYAIEFTGDGERTLGKTEFVITLPGDLAQDYSENPDKIGLFMDVLTLIDETVVTADLKIHAEGMSEALLQPFEIKCIPAYDAFVRLVNNIAGVLPVNIRSGILASGELRDIYLTSGDAVRGIEGAVLKTSFNDFFESLDAVAGVSLFHNSAGVSLESFASAFKNERIMHLGEVRNLTRSPYVDAMYNYIRIGNEDRDYQTANGRYEYNTANGFSLPLTRVTGEHSFIGPYRTDSFGITDLRLSYNRRSTESSDSDNSVFMIHGTRTNRARQLVPFDFQLILGNSIQQQRTGLFNLFFTPKRCLMRQQGRLASILQKTDGTVTYQTTAKSEAVLVSRMLDEYTEEDPVTEIGGIFRVDLSKAVFWPELFEFTCSVPDNLSTLMSERIGGYVSFNYEGKVWKGFPQKVSESPAIHKEQNMTLIAYPELPK